MYRTLLGVLINDQPGSFECGLLGEPSVGISRRRRRYRGAAKVPITVTVFGAQPRGQSGCGKKLTFSPQLFDINGVFRDTKVPALPHGAHAAPAVSAAFSTSSFLREHSIAF